MLGIRNIGTRTERRLTLSEIERWGDQLFQPHWSKDGRFLLGPGNARGNSGLYRIDAQTGETQLVASHSEGTLRWSTWSADGRAIFTRRMAAARSTVIVARDPTTGQEQELYRAPFPVRLSNVAVSPDAERVAFVSSDQEKGTTIGIVSMSGDGALREVIKLRASSRDTLALSWMPGSRDILYARGVGAESQKPSLSLWLISAGRVEPRELGLTTNGLPYGLSVHPNGRQIAFTAGLYPGTGRRAEVWVMKDLLR
jgi:Tol biopolymer transport system component